MRVVVTVTNDGDEPPDFARQSAFLVALDITASIDEPFRSRFVVKVLDPERSRIPPGGSIDVTVDVQFPCAATAWVRAEADTTRAIANNLHSQPPFAVVANPVLVPSLFVTLKADHDHSQGHQPNDNGVCPDREVKFVTVTNRLRALAGDDRGRPRRSRARSSRRGRTPSPIDPGKSYYPTTVTTPKLTSVPRTRPVPCMRHPNQLIVDQCDRRRLRRPREVGRGRIGAAPTIVRHHAEVIPGQFGSLESGTAAPTSAHVAVLYSNPPTTRARFGRRLPRERGGGGRPEPQAGLSPITIPPAIANTFWAIGKKTGRSRSGTATRAYRASYDIDVSPEGRRHVVGVDRRPLGNTTYRRSAVPATAARSHDIDGARFHRAQSARPTGRRTPSGPRRVSLPPPIAPGDRIAQLHFLPRLTWMSRPFFVRTGPVDVANEYTAHT
jgi:hypothetical protein